MDRPSPCDTFFRLTDLQLASLVVRHFPVGMVPQTGESIRATAYAVSRAESQNVFGCNWVDGVEHSIGLWQINIDAHPTFDLEALFDPDYNADAALVVSSQGSNWNPWCSWEASACGGAGRATYRAYLEEARRALAVLGGGAVVLPPVVPPSQPGDVPAQVQPIWVLSGLVLIVGGLALAVRQASPGAPGP